MSHVHYFEPDGRCVCGEYVALVPYLADVPDPAPEPVPEVCYWCSTEEAVGSHRAVCPCYCHWKIKYVREESCPNNDGGPHCSCVGYPHCCYCDNG